MHLVALVRTHNRHNLLPVVLDELLRYGTLGIDVSISLALDRPTPAVLRVAADYAAHCSTCEMPFALLSPEGEKFSEGLNLQLEDIERWPGPPPDWLYLADDDRWFEPNSITSELPLALADPDVDLWYCRSVFFWDSPSQYNLNRYHHTPLLSRYNPGDRFPTNRMISAPEKMHDQAIVRGRIANLKTPLLDYGSFNIQWREELYRSFEAAGKVDDYTGSLLRDPGDALRDYRKDFGDFKDLFSEQVYAG